MAFECLGLVNFAVYAGGRDSYSARMNAISLCRRGFVFGLLTLACVASAADRLTIPDYYECPRATGPIKLDGKAD